VRVLKPVRRNIASRKCAIDVVRTGVVSRGVLLDITKTRKVEWLEPGERVFREDLEQAEKEHGLRVAEGDVLLVRVGRARRRKVKGGWEPALGGIFPMAGLDPCHYRKSDPVTGLEESGTLRRDG
jgi:Putative cyclase